MKQTTLELFKTWKEENPALVHMEPALMESVEKICECYENGGKVLVCGNGGSASDSEHIVGELMKGFRKKRPLKGEAGKILSAASDEKEGKFMVENLQGGLPAISLVSHSALITAFANDVEPQMVFAQQVLGYGKSGDVFIGLSTSGNSKNVLYGLKVAKGLGMSAIGFTGAKDSHISEQADITLRSTETETYKVQEEHIKFYHIICAAVENEFYEE